MWVHVVDAVDHTLTFEASPAHLFQVETERMIEIKKHGYIRFATPIIPIPTNPFAPLCTLSHHPCFASCSDPRCEGLAGLAGLGLYLAGFTSQALPRRRSGRGPTPERARATPWGGSSAARPAVARMPVPAPARPRKTSRGTPRARCRSACSRGGTARASCRGRWMAS